MKRRTNHYGLSFGIVICLTNCATFVQAFEPIGVVLTYEIDAKESVHSHPTDIEMDVYAIRKRVGQVAQVKALDKKRLEVAIHGNPNEADLDKIKQLIGSTGTIEFRILANPLYSEDQPIIHQAKVATPNQQIIQLNGRVVAEWLEYDQGTMGPIEKLTEDIVSRRARGKVETLALTDDEHVTGEYLTAATSEKNSRGKPILHLAFNHSGAKKLEKLTREHLPKPNMSKMYRRLAIVFDKRLVSAPVIRTVISGRAAISGGLMSNRDVETIIEILNAGQLPCGVRLVDEKRISASSK